MSKAALSLVVIRSADLERASRFYEVLGLRFVREQHGGGPEHLAAESGGMVFEVYPQGDLPSTSSVRLGFRVTSLADALAAVAVVAGEVIAPARESPWGMRAIVVDPDGHRVELLEANGKLSSNAKVESQS